MHTRSTLAEKVVDTPCRHANMSTVNTDCSISNLYRALEFVYTFLEMVLSGEEDLVVCANAAYEKSLKRYHGWMVRGIFNVSHGMSELFNIISISLQLAVRAVPYRKDFIAALKKDPVVTDEQLYEDMQIALGSLKSNIDEINRFYTQKGQHSESTV